MHLEDVREIRRTLAARPPRVVRGTLVALVALLGSGVLWAAAATTDLVVTAPGRVRPIT